MSTIPSPYVRKARTDRTPATKSALFSNTRRRSNISPSVLPHGCRPTSGWTTSLTPA